MKEVVILEARRAFNQRERLSSMDKHFPKLNEDEISLQIRLGAMLLYTKGLSPTQHADLVDLARQLLVLQKAGTLPFLQFESPEQVVSSLRDFQRLNKDCAYHSNRVSQFQNYDLRIIKAPTSVSIGFD